MLFKNRGLGGLFLVFLAVSILDAATTITAFQKFPGLQEQNWFTASLIPTYGLTVALLFSMLVNSLVFSSFLLGGFVVARFQWSGRYEEVGVSGLYNFVFLLVFAVPVYVIGDIIVHGVINNLLLVI